MKIPTLSRSLSRKIGVVLLSLVVLAGVGFGGFYIGVRKAPTSPDGKPDLGLFWKAWDIVNANFDGDTMNSTGRVDGAISGMVSSLKDPFTFYLAPSENKLFQSDLQGNFGGIGADLISDNGQLTIQSVLSGTPAEKSGLLAKDIIIKIDGKKVANMPFNDAINAIRGTKGTVVTLNIERAGETAARDVSVTRDTITIKSVLTDTLGADKNIGYIKVNEFGQDTTQDFMTALQGVVKENRKGLIIDLRNDPGGYLDAAKAMIGMVLPATITSDQAVLKKRVAVLERSKDGSENQDVAGDTIIAPNLPIVVLVNGGSASASEIYAGAMKDYKRATVLGTQTFGKGSVQTLIDLGNGGSIKVTIAKWFTPLGVGIDGKGITPDIVVDLPQSVVPSTSDVQIQKALDILTK